MAGILEFFTAGVFHQTVSVDENAIRWQNGLISKLHAATGTLLSFFAFTVFAKELLGDHIRCIRYSGEDSIMSEPTFNSYCYISSTFTLPERNPSHPHPGVGPATTTSEFIFHSYYQWIPYLLFIQAMSFYVPYVCYKFSHDGRIDRLLQNLQNVIPFHETRDDKLGDIHIYLQDYYGSHGFWALKLVLSDFLNLVNIVFNLVIMQWYLGSNFLSYGVRIISHLAGETDEGVDPFDQIFPKMTKCTLEMYGPSGSIQNLDGLCVLPINVLNEKIFFILWLWLLPLGLATLLEQIFWLLLITNKSHRTGFLCSFVLPHQEAEKKRLRSVLEALSFADWLVLYLVARNVDRTLFTRLTGKIAKPGAGYYPDDQEEELQPLSSESFVVVMETDGKKKKKEGGQEKEGRREPVEEEMVRKEETEEVAKWRVVRFGLIGLALFRRCCARVRTRGGQ